jgi:hypothetical protein
MNDNDAKNENAPVIMIFERRTQRQAELSSSEIMRILRKRAAKGIRKSSTGGARPSG